MSNTFCVYEKPNSSPTLNKHTTLKIAILISINRIQCDSYLDENELVQTTPFMSVIQMQVVRKEILRDDDFLTSCFPYTL